MADTLADQINDQLLRLGYSTYGADAHGWLASPEPNPAHVVLEHPTRRFDVALYDAVPLLTALEGLPVGTPVDTLRATLAAHMLED